MKNQKFLTIILFLLFSIFFECGQCATRYFVGFSNVAPEALIGGTNEVVGSTTDRVASLLSVLGPEHTYNPTNGDTVFLAVGVYFLTKEITIPVGVTVLGGWLAESALSRTYPGSLWPTNVFTNMTVLDGNSFLSLPADKHRVATVYGTLETCLIRNGYSKTKGGGLYIDGGTVTHCLIRGNVAMNLFGTATGGGAYLTNGGKMYYCLVANNMANAGFGIQGGTVSNITFIYNTWAPRPILVQGTGGNNSTDTTIGTEITDVDIYFLRKNDNQNQRIQLSNFYMCQTETTVLQYCSFLAAVDYTYSDNDVKLLPATVASFVALDAFTMADGIKNIGEYYNFTTIEKNNGILCNAFTSDQGNTYGVIYRLNGVMYPREKNGNGNVPDDNIAVCFVSWLGAIAYSHWLGGALPTEAQWEFTYRRTGDDFSGASVSGVSMGAYPDGDGTLDDVGNYSWYNNNSASEVDADGTDYSDYGIGSDVMHAHKVGQKLPNQLNIYDMGGNLLEWCADRYWGYNQASGEIWYSANYYYGSGYVFLNYVVKRITAAGLQWSVSRGGTYDGGVDMLESRTRTYARDAAANNGFRPCWNLTSLVSLQ